MKFKLRLQWRRSRPRTQTDNIDTKKLDEYRQEIIKSGSRYRSAALITQRRIVGLSAAVLAVAATGFLVYVIFSVYRHQSYSQFTYSVTRILPLPAARIGSTLISYNSYLKELRRYIHYFEVQQQHDLTDPGAAASLLDFKQRSLKHVVNQAYIKKLAAANNIVVTDDELQAEFELLRQQNKLGSNDAVTASVLADFFGMTVDEYLNRVRDELLKQKVIASLDKNQAQATAEAVWRQARQPGADFAQLARDHSDDLVSSAVGGEYGFWLDRSEQNESPKILEAVFSTDVGEVSPIIQTGYRLEIIKVIEDNGEGKRRAAHISFYFSIEAEILRDIKAEQPPVYYLKLE